MIYLGRTFLALLLLLVVGSAEATTRSVVSNVTASGASVVLDTTDTANITLYIKGTWTGTFQFEGRIGAADWFAVEGTPIPSSGAVTETTANGTWTISTALREIRVRSSAFASGTATIEILAVDAGGGGGGGGGGVAGSVTQSGVWTVQPGNTANTTPWLASIAEGGATAQVTATSGGSLQVECSTGCSGGTQYTEGTTSATSIGTALVWKDVSDVMHAASSDNPLPIAGAVTGPVTDTQLRATPVPVSGPVTDTQLRATPVSVSGTITVGTFPDNEPFNLAQVGGAAPSAANPIPIRVSDGAAFLDPGAVDASLNQRVVGGVGHDVPASGMDPILAGCYASVNAPADVTADTDAVRAWCLRNGARAVQLTYAGALAPTGNGTAAGTPRVTLASDSTGQVGVLPTTAGGTTPFRRVSTADTNAANVKASAGQVYMIAASNVNAAARYLHLYNNASSPTCNTGIINSFIIPGNTAGAGSNIPIALGAAYGTGIALCITTGVDGTGSVAANEIIVNVFYK